MTDGRQAPFRPSQRPTITVWMREHILERHARAHHSEAEWPQKSQFPAAWSSERILSAVDLALADPGWPPRRLGDKVRFERIVDEQLIRVHVRVDLNPPEIWNAYPVDGDR